MAHDIDPFEDLGWKTRQRKWNCPLSTGNSTLIFKIVSPKFEDLFRFRLITSFLAFRRNRLIFYLYSFTLSLLSFVNSYPKITLIYQRKKKRERSWQQSYQICIYIRLYGELHHSRIITTYVSTIIIPQKRWRHRPSVFWMTRLQEMTLIFGHSSATR